MNNNNCPKQKSSAWFVYILECSDGTLYTGISNDLAKRIKQHNCGKGAKYTRGRLPVKLVYQENAQQKGKALQREHQIKQLSRGEKFELIKSNPEEYA